LVHEHRADSSWASSTLVTAVPIEAPVCWLMFSVVLALAIADSLSVRIAAEKVGIIVPPMPRPITNRSAPNSR
jgi:hypothetical protein